MDHETPPSPFEKAGSAASETENPSRRKGRSSRSLAPAKPSREGPALENLDIADLRKKSVAQLKLLLPESSSFGKEGGKEELIRKILIANCEKQGMKFQEGILEVNRGGYGFLRSPELNYKPRQEDTYVSSSMMEKYSLRPGDLVGGMIHPAKNRERYHTLAHVDTVWNKSVEESLKRKPFEELTPLHPQERLILETPGGPTSMRALDLLAPLGRGQRCLIVAPPRGGKTILLQQIAKSIGENHPDMEIMVLLLDERPEEVGNMRQVVKGEVISSTFDEPMDHHIRIAELIIEKAHRVVENGRHALVLLDSLTRMARAYNALSSARGKLMSGGVESGALEKPRKFFSSARNVEEGGSLTIVATVLVETGSKMDDLIFEEFKGTGNMEIFLSRDLQERRIFPAIHIEKSGTRKEEILYHPDEFVRIRALRRQLTEYPPLEAMERLIEQLGATHSNAELLMRLKME